jgi:uncharacterized protein (TIGR02453 family)
MATTTVERFAGFPEEALTFYRELELDNTKSFWQAHRATYERACEQPMRALLAELETEFGTSKMHRPYRDIRFSPNKSPYTTHCAAMIGSGGYVMLSADGLYVGGGRHDFDSAALTRYREAVAAEVTGTSLAEVIADLRRRGYEVAGESLRTAPRGYPIDHPRIELLRFKQLHAGRDFGIEPWLHSREAASRVRKVLRDIGPLVDWLRVNVG